MDGRGDARQVLQQRKNVFCQTTIVRQTRDKCKRFRRLVRDIDEVVGALLNATISSQPSSEQRQSDKSGAGFPTVTASPARLSGFPLNVTAPERDISTSLPSNGSKHRSRRIDAAKYYVPNTTRPKFTCRILRNCPVVSPFRSVVQVGQTGSTRPRWPFADVVLIRTKR